MAITLQGNGLSTFSNNITSTTGDLTLGDGNLVLADTHGIDFSATADGTGANQAELFDDYEEGAWTPTVSVGTVDELADGCKYTKVGNLVTVTFLITNFSNRSSNEYIGVEGLPFAFNTDTRAVGACMQRHTGYASVVAYLASNALNFYGLSTTIYTPLKYSHLSSTSANFFATITYETTQ